MREVFFPQMFKAQASVVMPRSHNSSLAWNAVRRQVTIWLRSTIGPSQGDAAVHNRVSQIASELLRMATEEERKALDSLVLF